MQLPFFHLKDKYTLISLKIKLTADFRRLFILQSHHFPLDFRKFASPNLLAKHSKIVDL